MEAGYQFPFRFGYIAGDPVGLGYSRDKEDHESDKLRKHKPQVLLCIDDFGKVKAVGHHDDTHE